jgi:hypothetical protein
MRGRLTVVGACSALALLVSTGWAESPPAPAAQQATGSPPATTTPGAASPPAGDASPENRLTGIDTDRMMIAAEAPTDIAINGTPGSRCAFTVEFGDGTRSSHVVSESTPFPLKIAHTYPKMADVKVRVKGAAAQPLPPCSGELEAAVHVSPAGSKIETITLATNACPEGWSLVGQVNADKSFKCTPVPDASAPTNLIHCTEGMKYFARGGNVGCAHPAAAVESLAQAMPPMRGRMGGKGGMDSKRGMGPKGGMGRKGAMKQADAAKGAATKATPLAALAATPEANSVALKTAAKPRPRKAAPPRKSRIGAEAPN